MSASTGICRSGKIKKIGCPSIIDLKFKPDEIDITIYSRRLSYHRTDAEIDRLVYGLYGLSDDEIKIIEEVV